MPGPKSNPPGGKTRFDRESGKWARHTFHARKQDAIRKAGGKQFGSSKASKNR